MTKPATPQKNACRLCLWYAWLGCVVAGFDNLSAVYADSLTANSLPQIVTNTAQFQKVFNESAGVKCPFHLTGTVTMVDVDRNLFVLQDADGVLAASLNAGTITFQPGQRVSVDGDQAAPYFEPFPNYPYQPSGWDIRASFEAPSNWGEYHLTRMRGYLHPPVTGDYTFWIASDNSSELWLSMDDSPSGARKIAFIKSGDWVNQHEWNRYASQKSETIRLNADKTYYIAAFAEQLLLDENLSVAWQPPGFKQHIIAGRYLTPWSEDERSPDLSATNGILREYWTNFTVGNLSGIADKKSLATMFVLKAAKVTVQDRGGWPEPQAMMLDQPLPLGNNFHWVKAQGVVDFIGVRGGSATFELSFNGRQVQVRVSDWKGENPLHYQNRPVQIEGVCEGMQTENGYLMPGLIWTPSPDQISLIESTNWDKNSDAINDLVRFAEVSGDTNHVWSGFVSIRGVVTFNDRVAGKDFLFIQNDAAGIFIAQDNHRFEQFKIGQWVEIGGTLLPGGSTPSLNPVEASILGRRPIPKPMTQPVEIPVVTSRNGQWTELQGVVHAVNPDGTLLLAGKRGNVSVWVGHVSPADLGRYVDATLRLRGVLVLKTADNPKLLVSSPEFVEITEAAPDDPFAIPSCDTTEINNANEKNKWIHRVKIEGVVTYNHEKSLFVQDAKGGLLVEVLGNSSPAKVGDRVEVAGFPGNEINSKKLTEAQMRVTGIGENIRPQEVNLTQPDANRYYGTLVSLEAKILTQKKQGREQILSLQQGQRLFEAVLPSDLGLLPTFEPDSRLKISGILDGFNPLADKISAEENELSASVKIFMRGPQDVVLLHGAPWWTVKGFLLLAGTLFAVVVMSLAAILILRRRLERQRQAKLIFSRQILQSQEDERRRIAVNLHDTLGQNLLTIKNQTALVIQNPTDETTVLRRLNQISEVTLQTIEEVRSITRNLRPYQLDRLGLTHAIRAVIKQASENVPIVFATDVDDIDGAFNKESEIQVFRIIQEGINNILKHSGATEATIVIKKRAGNVSLSIRDNGIGFDVQRSKSSSFGLSNIVERVWILGGESKIDSAVGSGTSLLFTIPITKNSHEA
jgi:signal transduction histidine kinase